MSTQGSQTKFTFDNDLQNESQGAHHPILDIPVLFRLIKRLMPELLLDTPTARTKLDQIEAYLSASNGRIVRKRLEKAFPKEVCTTLYGLKALLRGRNMNIVNWLLENSKSRFEEMLEEE